MKKIVKFIVIAILFLLSLSLFGRTASFFGKNSEKRYGRVNTL